MSDLIEEDYFDALDEIYRLRAALAYEADVVLAHVDYKTFPKSRRLIAGEQVQRMRHAAQGHSEVAYADTGSHSLKNSLLRAGASQTLTRSEWEAR